MKNKGKQPPEEGAKVSTTPSPYYLLASLMIDLHNKQVSGLFASDRRRLLQEFPPFMGPTLDATLESPATHLFEKSTELLKEYRNLEVRAYKSEDLNRNLAKESFRISEENRRLVKEVAVSEKKGLSFFRDLGVSRKVLEVSEKRDRERVEQLEGLDKSLTEFKDLAGGLEEENSVLASRVETLLGRLGELRREEFTPSDRSSLSHKGGVSPLDHGQTTSSRATQIRGLLHVGDDSFVALYSSEWDAHYDARSGAWLEDVCGDNLCAFCVHRPKEMEV